MCILISVVLFQQVIFESGDNLVYVGSLRFFCGLSVRWAFKGGRANVEVGEKELVVVCRLSVSSISNAKIQHQQSGLSFIVI